MVGASGPSGANRIKPQVMQSEGNRSSWCVLGPQCPSELGPNLILKSSSRGPLCSLSLGLRHSPVSPLREKQPVPSQSWLRLGLPRFAWDKKPWPAWGSS